MGLPPPAIDRHVHLEGALDPAWVARAAGDGPLPPSLEALWAGRAVPFEGFIEAFLFGARFLDSRQAIREAVAGTVRRTLVAGGEGFDLWVSPHFLVAHLKQISLDDLWRGIEAGLAEAETTHRRRIPMTVILDAVNHFGPAHGHAVLDLVAGDLPPFARGFSTGGLERVPFREWAPVFDRARALGLRIAAHAGENGPGANVREAVLEGGVERIVHGVRSGPADWELLAERRIPVDVCLSSNAALVPDLGVHPLPAMLAAGVRCALGTDDPGVILCDLAGEWAKARALGLSEACLEALRRNAAEDAWCLADSVSS